MGQRDKESSAIPYQVSCTLSDHIRIFWFVPSAEVRSARFWRLVIIRLQITLLNVSLRWITSRRRAAQAPRLLSRRSPRSPCARIDLATFAASARRDVLRTKTRRNAFSARFTGSNAPTWTPRSRGRRGSSTRTELELRSMTKDRSRMAPLESGINANTFCLGSVELQRRGSKEHRHPAMAQTRTNLSIRGRRARSWIARWACTGPRTSNTSVRALYTKLDSSK